MCARIFEVIKFNTHTVGSLTIPKASVKWVYLWELMAYILNMHSYSNANINTVGLACLLLASFLRAPAVAVVSWSFSASFWPLSSVKWVPVNIDVLTSAMSDHQHNGIVTILSLMIRCRFLYQCNILSTVQIWQRWLRRELSNRDTGRGLPVDSASILAVCAVSAAFMSA